MRRDQEVIYDGTHYQVVYNPNFVVRPFAVISKLSGHRVYSYGSEAVAVTLAQDREERIKMYAGSN